MRRLWLSVVAVTVLCICSLSMICPANAMLPPLKGDVDRFKTDGSFAKRMETALKIGNNKTSPYLTWKLQQKNADMLKNLSGTGINTQQKSNLPPPYRRGIPTKGTVKMLVLLIDFPDYPHTTNQTVEDISSKMFGNGDSSLYPPSPYPYESLHNFYQRSSLQISTYTLLDMNRF